MSPSVGLSGDIPSRLVWSPRLLDGYQSSESTFPMRADEWETWRWRSVARWSSPTTGIRVPMSMTTVVGASGVEGPVEPGREGGRGPEVLEGVG